MTRSTFPGGVPPHRPILTLGVLITVPFSPFRHRYVDQGGGKRKGAFAIYLEPWHADVLGFLDLKKNHGKEEAGQCITSSQKISIPFTPYFSS